MQAVRRLYGRNGRFKRIGGDFQTMRARKLTLRNQSTFFAKAYVGERFAYAFSSLCWEDARLLANAAKWRVKYIGGNYVEIIGSL